MLKINVTEEIEFAYHDSGAPKNQAVYDTIFMIHGHTFHSGTFKPMLEHAHSFGYRIIIPNRRLYPGSTPYTKEETASFQEDRSVDEHTKAYLQQGKYMLLLLYNIIKKHNLTNVVVAGWSLGSGFLCAAVGSISSVSEEIQSELPKAVKSFILWDPPTPVHGICDPPTGGWLPLLDKSLAPEERGQAFCQWLLQYFPHKDISKKDYHTLIYKLETPVKTPTFSGLSFEEFMTKVDLTAGPNGDNAITSDYFRPAGKIVRELSLFNPKTRSAWGDKPFSVIYGEEAPYTVLWAAWKLEEEAEETGMQLTFKGMPGANHYVMEDNPKLLFDTLKSCS